jgi:RIO kinase 1
MALRQGKRKLPAREAKQFKERMKIAGKVLDDSTIFVLVHLLNKKLLKSVDYPVSSGKESVVFRATAPDGRFLALKIFKYETRAFRHMLNYIQGDPRFKRVKKQTRSLVEAWARKEFANLRACDAAGVNVPAPIACEKNVVVMEFLGEGGKPYALLNDVVVENPEKMLEQILENMKKMYAAGLVHADLSQYNIVVQHETPFFIDLGQAVLLEHPKSAEFLERDVKNILSYFAKLRIEKSFEKALAFVKGSGKP